MDIILRGFKNLEEAKEWIGWYSNSGEQVFAEDAEANKHLLSANIGIGVADGDAIVVPVTVESVEHLDLNTIGNIHKIREDLAGISPAIRLDIAYYKVELKLVDPDGVVVACFDCIPSDEHKQMANVESTIKPNGLTKEQIDIKSKMQMYAYGLGVSFGNFTWKKPF